MWGTVELEPEVVRWLAGLSDKAFGQVEFVVERLATEGPLLGQPHTRHLTGKVRELRLGIDGERWRITYYFAHSRRIVLLPVFTKTAGRNGVRSIAPYAHTTPACARDTRLRRTDANQLV